MILEADEETRDFVTVYKKHYYPKRVRRVPKWVHPADYDPPLNALNGPFHEHLNSLRINEKLSVEERSEDIRDNLQRVRAKYPHLHKKLLYTTPDETVIESQQNEALKTIYQLEYSRHRDDQHSLHAKRTGEYGSSVTLPDDWVIPETIHKKSYRNPRELDSSSDSTRARKAVKPATNLYPNDEERGVLPIATGNSEYADVIGETARRIFKEQLHGVPIPLEAPSPRVKGPDSIRSECSGVLAARNAALHSHDL